MIQKALLQAYNQTRELQNLAHISQPLKVCYAPFSSLYFGQQGKVIACALNRSHVLGTYPQQSIHEIWTGEAAQALRRMIDRTELLNCGCQECAYQLKNRNFSSIKAKMFDRPRLHQTKLAYPSLLEFEIDNTCNLECVMCSGMFSSSIRKNREQLPPIINPYDDAFVEQLREFIPHVSQVHFFGGEPFLVPIHYKIWDTIAELNPNANLWVITNGTILNNRVKELLHKLKFNITFSIDSFNEPNYNRIRVNSDFKKVMRHFRYFYDYTKANGRDFTINSTYMKPNWRDIPQTVSKCNMLGISLNLIPVIHPKSLSLAAMTAKELGKVVHYFEGFSFGIFDHFSKANNQQYQSMVRLVKEWLDLAQNIEKVLPANGVFDKVAILQKAEVVLDAYTASISPDLRAEEKQKNFQKVALKIQALEDFWSSIDPIVVNAFLEITNTTNADHYIQMLLTHSFDELIKVSIYEILKKLLTFLPQLSDTELANLLKKANFEPNPTPLSKAEQGKQYAEIWIHLFAQKGLQVRPHMEYALKMAAM